MAFAGVWKVADDENFMEFMEEMKIPSVMRQAIVKSRLHSRLVITKNGRSYTVKHEDHKPHEYDFEPDSAHAQDFFGKALMFRTVKENENKFIHYGTCDRGEVVITREVVDSKTMILTYTVANVKSKLVFTYRK